MCAWQQAYSFADAGGSPGKSFLLFFRLLEAPKFVHFEWGSLAVTAIREIVICWEQSSLLRSPPVRRRAPRK